jgi:predicted amidohydrolase YtcJ
LPGTPSRLLAVASSVVVAVVAVVALAGLAACGGPDRAAPAAAPADLVLVGGDVITMDAARPRARAVAIRDGRVIAVGDDAEVRALAGAATRVVDLAGRTVTPGLVDAHCHLAGLGASLERVSLRGVASEADAVAAVAAAAAGRPAGEWVLGRGWDQNLWDGAFPIRATLDVALPDHPVALRRVDGHAVWVNSAALALAGVTAATPDPAGGRILRDATGAPTGVLVDNAMDLVESKIPAASADVIERRIRAAASYAVERGLTGVHDMGLDDATLDVYRRLAAADELPLRVNAYVAGDPAVAATLRTRAIEPGTAESHFQVRGVKIYADGALGSRGAALHADYSDEPGQRGNWVTSPAELRQAIRDAVDGGWQVAVHAIGDAAIHEVLAGYADALAAHPGADLRLRVEHAQIVDLADVPRFAALGVLASMQPTHATSDMPWAEARVGPDRIRGGYAWRTMLDAGVVVVGGSDFPVEEVSPLLGLYAAVTRQDHDGNPPGGWYPGERMTLDEAIHAFTAAAAYAGFAEAERGALRVGMVADVTVLDRAIDAAAPGPSLRDAGVAMTIVGGRVVFEAP